MAWSTSQLARMAGTSVSTIRFYHREGLLEEPEREANGYKKYEIAHLMALLKIKRLTELQVPLAEIAVILRDEVAAPDLSHIDAELQRTIDRLQRVRGELADIARHSAPADLPPGFSDVAENLSAADRRLVMLYSSVFGETEMQELHELLKKPRLAVERDFDELAADADESTRAELATRLRAHYVTVWTENPWAAAFFEGPGGSAVVRRVMADAVAEIHNPAQIDVLRRVRPPVTEG